MSTRHSLARAAAAPLVAAALVLLTGLPVHSQQQLTLQQVIERAQTQGLQSRANRSALEASRQRDRSFGARLLPQLSLAGVTPNYNRSIIPVVQPDGSTLFRPQQQTDASLNMSLTQRLPFTGGDLTVSSALSQLRLSGTSNIQTWSSTPYSVSLRQNLLRPNAMRWDSREQDLRIDVAERQFLEAREDVATAATNAFFDLYSAKLSLKNAGGNAAINDTLYTLNKGRFEVGKISENDLLQSELVLLNARTALDVARLAFDRSLAALRLLIDLPVGSGVDVAVNSEVPQFDADTTMAERQAMRNRSTVSDLELQDVQAKRRVNEARLNNGIGERNLRPQRDRRGRQRGVPGPAGRAAFLAFGAGAAGAVGGAERRGPGGAGRPGTGGEHVARDPRASGAGRALCRAATGARAAATADLGQGRHGGAEAVRGGVQPVRDRPDRHRRAHHRPE